MIPSKHELKEKYGITQDDFEVLTSPPSEEERAKKGGFFIRVEAVTGVKAWLWKSLTGVVLAVIWLAPEVETKVDYWIPKLTYSYSKFGEYLQSFSQETDLKPDGYIAFAPEQFPDTGRLGIMPDDLPIGSGIFPASTGWV